MKSPLMNIFISLYGEEFYEDFNEHIALLKEIVIYRKRERITIEQQAKFDFLYLADTLRHKYQDICCYFNDNGYWSYSEWFKKVFIKDYDKALIEIEQKSIPSNRELCILRIAREAAYKKINIGIIPEFFKVYNITSSEQAIFYIEYFDKYNNYYYE